MRRINYKVMTFEQIVKKLQPKFTINESTGCWLWTGQLYNNGYALLFSRVFGYILVHRLLYEKKFNVTIDKDKYDLHHKCEIKRCINPDHIEPLTKMQHQSLHKRLLTPEQVTTIIKLYSNGRTAASLAIDYNVSDWTICSALRNAGIKIRHGSRPTILDRMKLRLEKLNNG